MPLQPWVLDDGVWVPLLGGGTQVIIPLTITTTTLQGGEQDAAYSTYVGVDGGVAPYSWAVTAGALPAGLTLSASTGILSGTPAGPGSSTLTITVTDAAGATAARAYTLVVTAPAEPPPPPPTDSGLLVGVTATPTAFGLPATQYIQAASLWQQYTGTPAGTIAQKCYGHTGVPANYPGIKALHAANPGMKWLVSLIPSQTLTAVNKTTLAGVLAQMTADGLDYMVTLCQEPNAGGKFASPAAYQAYCAYYVPVLRAAGILHGYCPAVGASNNPVGYYPGDDLVDVVIPDYYCTSWSSGVRLDGMQALADNHSGGGVPFGIGEFGGSAQTGFNAPAKADWDGFMTYLISLFTSRAAAGKKNSLVMWFNGGTSADLQPANDLQPAKNGQTDYAFFQVSGYSRVPQIQALYAALNGI